MFPGGSRGGPLVLLETDPTKSAAHDRWNVTANLPLFRVLVGLASRGVHFLSCLIGEATRAP